MADDLVVREWCEQATNGQLGYAPREHELKIARAYLAMTAERDELKQTYLPSANRIAVILSEARIEDGQLSNVDYLAVKIAETFDPSRGSLAAQLAAMTKERASWKDKAEIRAQVHGDNERLKRQLTASEAARGRMREAFEEVWHGMVRVCDMHKQPYQANLVLQALIQIAHDALAETRKDGESC